MVPFSTDPGCAPSRLKSLLAFSSCTFYSQSPILYDLQLLLLVLHGLLSLLCCCPASTPSLIAGADGLCFPDLLLLLAGIPPVICCRLVPPAFHVCAACGGLPGSFATTSLPLVICSRIRFPYSALSYQQLPYLLSYPVPHLHPLF